LDCPQSSELVRQIVVEEASDGSASIVGRAERSNGCGIEIEVLDEVGIPEDRRRTA